MKFTKQHKTQPQTHQVGMRTHSSVRAGSCDTCELQPVTGRCRARLIRYYYDVNAGACKKFIYGGCEGNDNNFKTVEKCQTACG